MTSTGPYKDDRAAQLAEKNAQLVEKDAQLAESALTIKFLRVENSIMKEKLNRPSFNLRGLFVLKSSILVILLIGAGTVISIATCGEHNRWSGLGAGTIIMGCLLAMLTGLVASCWNDLRKE